MIAQTTAAKPEPLPCLTVRGLWAWAIMYLGKDIENRDWFTRRCGRIGIHMAKGWTRAEHDEVTYFIRQIVSEDAAPLPAFDALPLQCLLGTVELLGSVDRSPSPWFVGEYGLVLRDPRPLATPIKTPGRLSFWTYEGDLR